MSETIDADRELALAAPATTGGAGRDVVAFFRCTSARFTCYYFLAFYAGLAGSGRAPAGWLAFGAFYWLLHSTVTELLNRLADRTADEVNRPERTALCRQVGYRRLRLVAVVSYPLLVVLGVVWLWLVPTWAVAALLVVANFLCFNYSYGLRLGRSRVLSLAVLGFPFLGTFAGGWALAHPHLAGTGSDFLHAVPILLIGGLAKASLSGVKDLTDVAGDRLKGYRSGFLALVRPRPALVGAGVASLPFVALVGFVATSTLAARHLVLLVFLPAALLLADGIRLASDPADRFAVREFFYNYWMLFLALLTVLWVGTVAAALVAGATLVCWRLATVYLHWAEDTSLGWMLAVPRLHGFWRPQPEPER